MSGLFFATAVLSSVYSLFAEISNLYNKKNIVQEQKSLLNHTLDLFEQESRDQVKADLDKENIPLTPSNIIQNGFKKFTPKTQNEIIYQLMLFKRLKTDFSLPTHLPKPCQSQIICWATGLKKGWENSESIWWVLKIPLRFNKLGPFPPCGGRLGWGEN